MLYTLASTELEGLSTMLLIQREKLSPWRRGIHQVLDSPSVGFLTVGRALAFHRERDAFLGSVGSMLRQTAYPWTFNSFPSISKVKVFRWTIAFFLVPPLFLMSSLHFNAREHSAILSCNVAAAAMHCNVAAAELVSLSAQLLLCCCPNKIDKLLRSINLKEFSTIGGAINCGASNHVLYVVFCRNLNPFLIDIWIHFLLNLWSKTTTNYLACASKLDKC